MSLSEKIINVVLAMMGDICWIIFLCINIYILIKTLIKANGGIKGIAEKFEDKFSPFLDIYRTYIKRPKKYVATDRRVCLAYIKGYCENNNETKELMDLVVTIPVIHESHRYKCVTWGIKPEDYPVGKSVNVQVVVPNGKVKKAKVSLINEGYRKTNERFNEEWM